MNTPTSVLFNAADRIGGHLGILTTLADRAIDRLVPSVSAKACHGGGVICSTGSCQGYEEGKFYVPDNCCTNGVGQRRSYTIFAAEAWIGCGGGYTYTCEQCCLSTGGNCSA